MHEDKEKMIAYVSTYDLPSSCSFSYVFIGCCPMNIIAACTQLGDQPLMRKLHMEMLHHAHSGQHYNDNACASSSATSSASLHEVN